MTNHNGREKCNLKGLQIVVQVASSENKTWLVLSSLHSKTIVVSFNSVSLECVSGELLLERSNYTEQYPVG